MNYRRLGRSAMTVSDICMGTMTFGSQVDEATSHRILDASLDKGINFFDAAEVYPVPPDPEYAGRTEEFVGRWMKQRPREKVILATKVAGPSHVWFKAPQRSGMTALDRRNIMSAVEGSLKRLQTDYIDLYQTHWPDHDAPYDDIMRALDDLVQMGKVRAVGCSNETSWGLMKALGASAMEGLARYETIQNNFSLNNRRFEDELAQVARKEGVSLLPYSPIGGGVLTLKYNNGQWPDGARFSKYKDAPARQAAMARRFVNEKTLASAERFAGIAQELSVSPATLAVAWSKQHDFVASTIVGVTSEAHLADIFAAIDFTIPADALKKIDAVSKEIRYPMG